MPDPKVRRLIALEAARLMYAGDVAEYYRAKRKAAQHLRLDPKPKDLPSNAEIRTAILEQASLLEGERRTDRLLDMRLAALALMRHLAPYQPRLIGSVLTGHVRSGSDIDLHVFARSATVVASVLDALGLPHVVERKQVMKHGERRVFTHVHVSGMFPIELTVYAPELVTFPFTSSITGRPIEKASIAELEALLAREYPDLDVAAAVGAAEPGLDALEALRLLLVPLEGVKQHPKFHPEGDALYHSLQVYDLVAAEVPWDVELQLAALLHDVGKAIDPADHVGAGEAALAGLVSDRVRFLVRHHMDATAELAGTLGARTRRELKASPFWDDLMILARADRKGRVSGISASDLDGAIDALRALMVELGDWEV